ncbi:MAG: branched-chain amino acid ABC transporter permease [Thermomicrobiales bacterium]|nr:branched-chain amino acid ABC transporter permease [Thermomicrobiales bacterium]
MEFNANLFVQFLINGVTNGMLIALVALGYTLVYGIVELINFAHGEVFMMGALFAFTIIGMFTIGPDTPWFAIVAISLLALAAAMLFSGALNWAIDRVVYRRLRNAPRLAPLIAAIGLSFILQGIGIYWIGSNNLRPPNLIANNIRSINLLNEWFGLDTRIRLRPLDLIVVGITIPLLVWLSWFVGRTKTGKAMRATAQDREAAALMGIDVNRTIAIAFLLGGLLAGAAAMVTMYYTNTASFRMGFRYGLFAFTAAVLGGIGNLTGAVVGGLLIGIVWQMSDGFVQAYIPWWGAQWTPVAIFGVLVLVMVFKPGGLLGEFTPDKV